MLRNVVLISFIFCFLSFIPATYSEEIVDEWEPLGSHLWETEGAPGDKFEAKYFIGTAIAEKGKDIEKAEARAKEDLKKKIFAYFGISKNFDKYDLIITGINYKAPYYRYVYQIKKKFLSKKKKKDLIRTEVKIRGFISNSRLREVSNDLKKIKDGRVSKQSDSITLQVQCYTQKQTVEGELINYKLEDGSVLKYGDKVRIDFLVNKTCYVYIYWFDSSGNVFKVFPAEFSIGENPVKSMKMYNIPSSQEWFYLDENTGKEYIYVMVNSKPNKELEEMFNKLSELSKSLIDKNEISLQQKKITKDIEKFSVNFKGIGGKISDGGNLLIKKSKFQKHKDVSKLKTELQSIESDFIYTISFIHR